MRTKSLTLVSIAGFGFALWLARGTDLPKSPTTIATAAPAAVAQPFPRAAGTTAAATAAAPAAAPQKLDVKSEAFRNRIDDQIPSHLYGEAARCYKGGLQRDQRLDLTYRIRVSSGAVTISDVRTTESTLGDPSLERCIRDTIASAHWRDDELPDLNEEDDLYMRVAGFAARLANNDDDDAPSSAMN